MSFGETVVWYVATWIPGVLGAALMNYLVIWLPVILILMAFGIFRTKGE